MGILADAPDPVVFGRPYRRPPEPAPAWDHRTCRACAAQWRGSPVCWACGGLDDVTRFIEAAT